MINAERQLFRHGSDFVGAVASIRLCNSPKGNSRARPAALPRAGQKAKAISIGSML
jgi:hypothetical protein